VESGRDEKEGRGGGKSGEVRGIHLFLMWWKGNKRGRNEKNKDILLPLCPTSNFLKDKIEISHICLKNPSFPPILFKLYL
jgi:hypothetical protein